LKISLVVSALLILFCVCLFFLAKRHLIIAKYFANMQTLTFIVATMELTILKGDVFEN
jgi:hypothetical protein